MRGVGGAITGALVVAACGGAGGGSEETSTTTGVAATSSSSTTTLVTSGADGSTSMVDPSGDSSSETGDPPEPTCPPDEPRSSLELLGYREGVAVGPAPELGLARFTVEAWIRWEGYGASAGSGSGGVRGEPIAGKGRGENDGSNADCNYFFAVSEEGRLVGDFEDMETGANHPVTSMATIPTDRWTHVAMTFDGAALSLFVDGALDIAEPVSAEPRSDSIQHFGIGRAYDSTGVPAGSFDGFIDNVRVWDRPLTAADLAAGMHAAPPDTTGLIAHWPLDDTPGDTVPDVVGAHDGTRAGGRWTTEGPPIAATTPPEEPVPVEQATVPAGDVELRADVGDPDDDPLRVDFYGRELPDAEPFAIVVLPDTQYYVSELNGGLMEMFDEQTQWVVDNAEFHNIRAALHVGDLVQTGHTFVTEWQAADAAMGRLETVLPDYPDGMPYGIAIGNHDQAFNTAPQETQLYNMYFGVDRFEGRGYYGGQHEDVNDASYITFTAGELNFLALFFEYDQPDNPAGNEGPNADVLEWGRRVMRDHPDHVAFVATHSCLRSTESNPTVQTPFSPQGQIRYDTWKGESNWVGMVCGHVRTEGRRVDEARGVVNTLLADYQFDGMGGSGKLRLMTFRPADGEVDVQTYSPYLDEWFDGPDSQFTIPFELDRGAGEFELVGTVEQHPGGEATVTWTNRVAGRRYEWYAEATDCVQATPGPRTEFVVQ